MIVNNYKTLELVYRPSYLKRSEEQFLVASRDGDITIFTKEAEELRKIKLEDKIESIDFVACLSSIVYSTKEHIKIIDYQKNHIKKFSIKNASIYIQAGLLWSISKVSHEELHIQVFNLDDFREIASISMVDELHDSASLLYKGYDDKSLVLWLAAGQDGYCNYLLQLDNELSVNFIGNYSSLPMVFHKSGKQFLLGKDEGLSVLTYPNEEIVRDYVYPEDAYNINDYDFLNEYQVLFHGENGLNIYNLKTNKIVEVSIKGHEPKHTSFYYPSLCNDEELTTDIDFFELFDELILFVCSNNRVNPRTYSLLLSERIEFLR